MKKTATGLTLAAALSLTAFSAAPASALDRNGNFQNCDEVYAAGFSHIGPEHPQYDSGLDNSDDDLIGCENPENAGYYDTKKWAPSAPSVDVDSDLPDHVTQPDSIDNQFTYPDCKDVFAAGLANLPESSEYYHADLDADLDGIGCEVNGDDAADVPAEIVAKYTSKKSEDEDASDDEPQVTVVPEGTPDTGAEGTPLAPFAAGALALAAVAGTGVALRRRQA
ncbi:excalibur calcium-binding domain-containing protein [Micrococcus lacusdianchii]|uniref:excalibur calcium-binding domain-containing protein n=1 Tax=Micrococcus lacusdianchii TaxID=2915940 RepID=UPI0020065DA5|nr:excalibur calcium-binding domain-containing protein [Micrococcus sp. JXJ CY 30]